MRSKMRRMKRFVSMLDNIPEMNANNTCRPRANTTGDLPSINDEKPVTCPDWGCGFDEQIYSRSWSSSGSISDVTDDSLEDSIEDKHFAKALNQGVFGGVHEKNRKDRKKSFDKDHHHHHSHSNRGHHHHSNALSNHHNSHYHQRSQRFIDDDSLNNNYQRPRSKSIDLKLSSGEKHHHHHGKKANSKQRRLRQELSDSGFNLNDTTEKLSIDEIYEMQNRFFTSLKLTNDYIRQCSNDECGYMEMPSSPVRKNRSVSFH